MQSSPQSSIRRCVVACTLIGISLLLASACRQGSTDDISFKQVASAENNGLTVSLHLSKTALKTSETVLLKLVVDYPPTANLVLPDETTIFGDFHVFFTQTSAPRLIAHNRARKIRTMELEPDLPGTYSLPPLTIRMKLADAPEVTLAATGAKVTVTSVLQDPDHAEMHDIVTELGQTKSGNQAFLLFVLFGLPILVILILWRRDQQPTEIPPVSILAIALKSLEKTTDEPLRNMQEVLIRFAQARFNIKDPITTIDTLITRLTRHIPADDRLRLEQVIEQLQYTRFSKAPASTEQIAAIKQEILIVLKALDATGGAAE